MKGCVKLSSGGLDAYSNGYILHNSQNGIQLFFLSLIGTPMQIDGVSANLYKGSLCNLETGGTQMSVKLHKSPVRTHTRKIDMVINRIIHSRSYFNNEPGSEDSYSRVVFGPNLASVKEQAFLRLNAVSSIPMLPEWSDWFWGEILLTTRLDSFGPPEFSEAWLITWQSDNEIESMILDAIKNKILQ